MVFPDSRPVSKELERGNLQYVFNTFADKDSNKRLFERLQTIGMNPSADIGFLRVIDYGPNRNAFGDLPGGVFDSLEKSLNSITIMKKDAAIDLIVPALISDLAVENDDTDLGVALGPDSVGFYAYFAI